ncbi:MAG: LVIVD repeat-containing protein [Actinomycetota bacterium]
MRTIEPRGSSCFRRAAAILAVLAVATLPTLLPSAHGEVVAESKRFRLIEQVPLGGVAVSGQVVDDTYFISSWQTGLYSYDVSNPAGPQPLDHMTADEIGIQSNENEDMATNGEILLLSRFNRVDALNELLVIDVRNPKEMKVIARLAGAGGHTITCLFDCKWAYGSSSGSSSAGTIIDLRNPRRPRLLDRRWSEAVGGVASHDVTEVRPGLVVTSSNPMFVLDVSDPRRPRPLMRTDFDTPHTGHNNIWPRAGNDRFLFSASEGVNNGRCEMYGDDGKTLQVWDTRGWRRGGFEPVGAYTLTNGEGHPPVDALGVQGCSAHWAQAHPDFRNGGLVAMAAYSHGVRLLDIGRDGKPREVGYYLKDVHGAIDVEWINDRILYVVEDGAGVGGFDVIKYTGPLPQAG